MSRGLTRAERLREMERLYVDRGWTDLEMAKQLGVDRTVVFKDRHLLETEIEFQEIEHGRWKINRNKYVSAIRVNLHEALALYLAARRASNQTRIAQAHVANALEKLAVTLRQPMTERLARAANAVLLQKAQPERVAIMETVARSWVEQKKVRLTYLGLHATRAWNFLVSPYLIEPSAWSDSVYVIGHSDVHNEIAAFKIERIEHAALTDEPFVIPETFSEEELLRYAWGIWRGEGEPQTVVLRFAAGAATRRVKETVWHRLEQVDDLPDGGCEWRAPIGEWKEMVPWVRGWGSDVTVIEPAELREAIIKEVKRMAQMYAVMPEKEMPPYLRLWAKADRKSQQLHRLLYHMLDVGLTAQTLWQAAMPQEFKTFLAESCGVTVDEAARLVAYWAALHDLGKASPIFQWHHRLSKALQRVVEPELRAAGIAIPQWSSNTTTRHEIISVWALVAQGEAGLWAGEMDGIWAKKVAAMIGGHHGEFPKSDALNPEQLLDIHRGGAQWDELRAQLFAHVKNIFTPPTPRFKEDLSQEQENRWLALIAAFISIADWIGSDQEFFTYEQDAVDVATYIARAQTFARDAVAAVGFTNDLAALDEIDFEMLFQRAPRPLQQKVLEVTQELDAPALVILEAPTGIGKTEAALFLADRWSQRGQATGMYVAMPTMATSNQMHGRTVEYVQARYGAAVETLLVHSQAELKLREAKNETGEAFEDSAREQDRVTARTWFLPRKRSLLAPFGVGTVDQSLMSILQTKHFFVRLFGLHRKVVIFDEVHAYDTYMTELFKLLLKWLRALDTSVILLSATLPDKTRRELVKAYTGNANLPPVEYPRLTIGRGDGTIEAVPLPKPSARHLALDWIERDPVAIAARVKRELAADGCAAVICNTVERAQQVYAAIVDAEPDCAPENILLFHARSPRIWRNVKEKTVLEKFGPPEKSMRPSKAIVVATQVIEQSLDLDFDVLLTDLAPIDFLIQRAGRLQRHERGARAFPDRLVIARTLNAAGAPEFENDVWVYHLFTLLGTWFALRQRAEMNLPDDTPRLIEQVYGAEAMEGVSEMEKQTLEKARANLERKDTKEQLDARAKLIPEPNDYQFKYGANLDLDEDDPTLHKAFRALTRNDALGLSLLCLHRTARGLALEPKEHSPTFDVNAELEPEQVKQILLGVVNVRKHRVVDYFLENNEMPKAWCKSHALRYLRLAIFENGVCDKIPTLQLHLDERLGLRYIEPKEAT